MAVTLPGIASSQEYRADIALNQGMSWDANEAARGATARINVRVPLDGRETVENDPTVGFTMAYGQQVGPTGFDGSRDVRNVEMIDLRFDEQGPRTFEVANLQVSDFGRDDLATETTRMSLDGDSPTTYMIGSVVILAVIFAVAFSGGDE